MKNLCYLFFLLMSTSIVGQSIIGQWVTFDDRTKQKKAIIEIYQIDDRFYAKILTSFIGEKNARCETCKGSQKNKPIRGLVIIEHLKKDGNEFNGGTILDPENGQHYKCYLKLVDKNKLKVRGYLGVSLFGRTQYWTRKK